jgi:hypothetical protein
MANVLLALQPGVTIGGLVSGNITTPERMTMLAGACCIRRDYRHNATGSVEG